MNYFELILLITGGFFAGFVNALAGNGSLITLTLLLEFIGLPALTANGTNRVGILFHSMITSRAMHKHHRAKTANIRRILPVLFVGGIIGGLLSIYVSAEQFIFVYRALLVLLFFVLLINPKKWIQGTSWQFTFPPTLRYPILFVIGIYGGFIQMGMSVILLAVLVLLEKLPLMEANTIKLFAVLVYTPIVFALFLYHGLIDWYYGLLLAIGQIIGGWVTANYISRWKHANTLAYLLLLTMVCVALLKIVFY